MKRGCGGGSDADLKVEKALSSSLEEGVDCVRESGHRKKKK